MFLKNENIHSILTSLWSLAVNKINHMAWVFLKFIWPHNLCLHKYILMSQVLLLWNTLWKVLKRSIQRFTQYSSHYQKLHLSPVKIKFLNCKTFFCACVRNYLLIGVKIWTSEYIGLLRFVSHNFFLFPFLLTLDLVWPFETCGIVLCILKHKNVLAVSWKVKYLCVILFLFDLVLYKYHDPFPDVVNIIYLPN